MKKCPIFPILGPRLQGKLPKKFTMSQDKIIQILVMSKGKKVALTQKPVINVYNLQKKRH